MRAEHRTVLTLAAAIFLPLLLLAAVETAAVFQAQRRDLEDRAMDRAREANAVIDGQLWSDLSALGVLSTSQYIQSHDWAGAQARLRQVQAERPRWKNAVLTDLRSGREILETATRLAAPTAARPSVARFLAGDHRRTVISGIWPGSPPCPCVVLHRPVFERGSPTLVLTLEVGPQDIQAALLSHAAPEPGGVSGVVDRDGRFVARSRNAHALLGRPGSPYLETAIRSGRRQGLYHNVTLEGVDSYTAFVTSALSGWSTHIAMRRATLASPEARSLTFILLAALIAVGLAGAIGASALAQTRERQRLAARGRQAQKLEAMGQLASGVAHDFNNLLTIIIGNLQRLADKVPDEAFRGPVTNALEAAQRGARLAGQLLGFARSGPVESQRVDLETLLERARELLVQSLRPGIALNVSVAPDARWVRCAPDGLELALINLAVNARDAMPGGGAFSIRATAVRAPGDWVDIAVADTGEGMSTEVLQRVTEPFFTTKADGQGTGLGMAQVLATVTACGGSLDVQSRPGQGTTVTLRLPAAG